MSVKKKEKKKEKNKKVKQGQWEEGVTTCT